MKGLKKVALVSAIAAVSAGAQAELKALDDAAMGELTGQAGLTIDIESQLSIGEFAYVDAGAVVFKDIYQGGKDDASGNRTMLDNIRLTLDVAGVDASGNAERFNYGMSEVRGLAAVTAAAGNTNAEFGAVALGDSQDDDAAGNALTVDGTRAAGDGDLVLHFGFTDAWHAGGGFAAYATGAGKAGTADTVSTTSLDDITWADAREIVSKAVDFQYEIGQIALADSGYGAGIGGDVYSNGRLGQETIQKTDHATGLDADVGGANTTTLISDLKMSGYLGPVDIIIENNGNGFATDNDALATLHGLTLDPSGNPTAGVGDANSKILWDSYVKVTDLDLYIDIAGVQISDVRIHNERGDLSGLNVSAILDPATGAVDPTTINASSSFGFAHSKREIYAVKDAVLHVENFYGAILQGATATDLATAAGAMVDGIAINTQFKGDIDVGALSFGDTGKSIGSLYFTDIQSTSNWTISAH